MLFIFRTLLLIFFLTPSNLLAYNHVDRFELRDFGKMKNMIFHDLDGKQKTISSYKGKYVLLTFWATWCKACVSEIPALENLARQFKHDGLVIAAISRNYPPTMGLPVQNFRLKGGFLNLEFLTDIDSGQLHKEYNVQGLPTSILIDRGGRVIGRLEGAAPWNNKDFVKFFQDVLDDKIKPQESQLSFWEKFSSLFK